MGKMAVLATQAIGYLAIIAWVVTAAFRREELVAWTRWTFGAWNGSSQNWALAGVLASGAIFAGCYVAYNK